MKRILLADVFNLYNRGERLCVEAIIKHLSADYGYLSIYSILDPHFFLERKKRIELVKSSNARALIIVQCFFHFCKAWLYHRTGNKRFLNGFLQKIINYDLAVDLGGETFQDRYNLLGMLKHVYTLTLFSFLRLKYSVISHTIIFKNAFWWRISKPLLMNAVVLTVRDPDSQKFLRNQEVNCFLVPDVAFAFNKIKSAPLRSQINIGVNASPFIQKHVNAYVNLVNILIERGYNVYLIPHVVSDRKRDDRLVLLQVWRKLKKENQHNVTVYLGNNFQTIKNLIDKCHIWVGSRFHSVIYALGRGIPSICIGYSDKSLHLKHLLGELVTVVDGESPTFTEDITNKILEIVDTYDVYVRKFQEEIGIVKEEAMKHIEMLRGAI